MDDRFSSLGGFIYIPLGLQIPSKKVFNPQKTPQSTFLEGIWSPRDSCTNKKFLASVSGSKQMAFLVKTCLQVPFL